ncbi:MAG: hypothetical protein JRI68_24685 [Deltaproteobacteria bacterium]|nr:hypothetical protein [Deltaproteobacteria bacterium]
MASLRWWTVALSFVPIWMVGCNAIFGIDEASHKPTSSVGHDGAHLWSLSFGAGDQDAEECEAVAIAPDGSVAMTGYFQGTAALGDPSVSSAGGMDVFVALYDANGEHQWSQPFGDGADQTGTAIAFDEAGYILVAGLFDGTLQLPGQPSWTSAVESDLFVAKLSSNGSVMWVRAFQSTSGKSVTSIAVAPNDEIVLVGSFLGTLDFGKGDLVSEGEADLYVARLASNGSTIHSQRFGNLTGRQAALDVAVTSSGGVVVVGSLQGDVDFGGGVLPGLGAADAFVVELDGDGDHVWSDRFGGADNQSAESVAIDPNTGDVVLTGPFRNSITVGGNLLTTAGPERDVFLARLGPGGAHQWSRSFTGLDGQVARRVAVHSSGDIAIAGRFMTDLDLGGGSLSAGFFWTMFVGKLDGAGNHIWSRSFGDFTVEPEALEFDAAGGMVVGGFFSGALDFGGGPIGSPAMATAGFLAKLGP